MPVVNEINNVVIGKIAIKQIIIGHLNSIAFLTFALTANARTLISLILSMIIYKDFKHFI